MKYFAIPLGPAPQAFEIALGGITYRLTARYRDLGGGWVLDIADAAGNPLVSGVPMVTGTNLLGQYGYLGFKGALWVQGGGNPDNPPTFYNLGTEARLYWVNNEDMQ